MFLRRSDERKQGRCDLGNSIKEFLGDQSVKLVELTANPLLPVASVNLTVR
jgi:hypothetical protein